MNAAQLSAALPLKEGCPFRVSARIDSAGSTLTTCEQPAQLSWGLTVRIT
jgi:hypothetical protein